MTDRAVKATGLGKRYFRRLERPLTRREFWALRNLDLDIRNGEVFGIIGRNGAGKSTLLKILAGVTVPTEGTLTVHGRINALLELGTGFHPDLTGYENLFICGALHGLSRNQIKDRLESILDFADIGAAGSQPLRTYSSGMYLRLAFALAMHTGPDVLMLDEIIAVGDDRFQKKCYSAIRRFQMEGVTILLVSHDLKQISLLCDRAMLLESGKCADIGAPDRIIETYNRYRGKGIVSGSVSLLLIDSVVHLFDGERRLTGPMGLYTSVRSRGIWYDSLRSDWQRIKGTGSTMVLTSRNLNIPLVQTWTLAGEPDGGFDWTVEMKAESAFPVERIQINVMLDRSFDRWSAGPDADRFPGEFSGTCGEDWERVWIGPPDAELAAQTGDSTQRVLFQPGQPGGAGVIVNSNPEFKSRVLQQVMIFPYGIDWQPGDRKVFRGRIRLEKRSRTAVSPGFSA